MMNIIHVPCAQDTYKCHLEGLFAGQTVTGIQIYGLKPHSG